MDGSDVCVLSLVDYPKKSLLFFGKESKLVFSGMDVSNNAVAVSRSNKIAAKNGLMI